ncbi:MAG TPA: cytochrome c [Armatimonadota bacterium]|jgi:mono/diheme cytochrome c family protein
MRSLRWILHIIVLLVIVALVGICVMYSGMYNVAANYPDRAPVAWFFDTTLTMSVRNHSEAIKVSPLTDPKMIERGFRTYNEMCVGCHGAPGIEIPTVIKSMNPEPPELAESAADWKPNELFWLTKNGVRMTGMPAWDKTLKDDQIWDAVAFMNTLPKMSPAEYEKLIKSPVPQEKR